MMDRKITALLFVWVAFLIGCPLSKGQTGTTENFNDNVLTSWTGSALYTLSETNQELSIAANIPSGYNVFSFAIPSSDLSANPYVKIKVKCATAIKLRVDFEDAAAKSTNASPLIIDVAGNNTYQELTFNFTGRFSQTWPAASTVNATQIVKVVFFVNPGGAAFNGTLYFDDLLVGSDTGILPPPGDIKLNQLGYYPKSPKVAIGVSSSASTFYILSEDLEDTVYTGTLGTSSTFSMTGETVMQANFTDFEEEGKYYLNIPGIGNSHPFEIKPAVHHAVSKAGLKGFYYQRASTALPAAYAGPWARAAGHPDNSVMVHNSAASAGRPTGTIISSPRGWYDAGDYNKYIVSAGISTNMLMTLYEHYPTYFDTLDLNIPESNNTLPDLLDEVLWEVRWLLTMQDPYDGGVYSKLTTAGFGGTVMPNANTAQRYVVKKSTAAALDFAATLAQASRVFKQFEAQLPELADSCLAASKQAWKWARLNPSQQYVQSTITAPTISTGEYGDNTFGDEFQWAAMELYASTLADSFYTLAGSHTAINPPGWANVRALGYLSLSHLRKELTPIADTTSLKGKLIDQANYLKSRAGINPYGTSMYDSWAFSWGGNSNAATHGMLLLHAYDLTKDVSYLNVAIANMDYLMGRNGANYCFVTGFGTVSPTDIHHRISGADGVTAPVPGLLVGGPNTDDMNDCGAAAYPSGLKGKAYLDAYCSYSTNEIAINWNAPFAYLSNALEAIDAKNNPPPVTSLKDKEDKDIALNVYPNPTKDRLTVDFNSAKDPATITITDVRGTKIFERENTKSGAQSEQFDLSGMNKGLYYLILKAGGRTEARKILVE